MKILLINTLYWPYRVGGAEISVQLLAEELVKFGHQVKVVCLHEKKYKKSAVINGVNVSYLPIKNIYFPFDGKSRNRIKKLFWHILDNFNPFYNSIIQKEILSFSPDIVHSNNIQGFSVSIWKIIKKCNVKLVHTSRDYYLFHPNSTLFDRKNKKNINDGSLSVRVWSLVKKKYSFYVDSYVGISDFILKKHLNNGFFKKSEKFDVIYNPIKKLDISPNPSAKIVVGFIGRLSLEKGFDKFCSISTRFNPSRYKFVAAGNLSSDSDQNQIESLTENCNVELLGYIGIEKFLSLVDVVIFPLKWNEPFGRAVVECTLAGKEVYSYPVGGVTELIELFPNLHALDDKIDFHKGNLYEITESLACKFSASSIARQYINNY